MIFKRVSMKQITQFFLEGESLTLIEANTPKSPFFSKQSILYGKPFSIFLGYILIV